MKTQILMLITFTTALGLHCQQIIDDNFVLVPHTGIISPVGQSSTRRQIAVNSHYVGRYPESNYQYLTYLNSLKDLPDSIYNQALPQSDYLESIGLEEPEISFFVNEYMFDEKYEMYPIVGLNYNQIKEYFEWKTEELIFAYLEYKNLYIRNDESNMTIKSYIDSTGFLPIQIASYRIPTPSVGISDIKSGYNRLFAKIELPGNQFFKWLKNHHIYSHLSVFRLNNKRHSNEYLEEFELNPSKYYDLKRVRKIMKTDFEIAGMVLDFKEPEEDDFVKIKERGESYFAKIVGVKLALMDFVGRVRFSSINRVLCPIRSYSLNLEDELSQLKRADLEYSNLK